jgi:hypothetical protein
MIGLSSASAVPGSHLTFLSFPFLSSPSPSTLFPYALPLLGYILIPKQLNNMDESRSSILCGGQKGIWKNGFEQTYNFFETEDSGKVCTLYLLKYVKQLTNSSED